MSANVDPNVHDLCDRPLDRVACFYNGEVPWRPNLRDEGDNHLIELAVAGNATTIATNNLRDFQGADLLFPNLLIATPEQLLTR